MSYSTLTDIKAHIPEVNLIQLTDDEELGVINEERVNEAISYADQLINGYLRGRYALPLNPVPTLIQKLSIDLAVFHLYSRRLELEMPETMLARYNNAVKFLKQIQDGIITIGTDSGDSPAQGEYKTQKTEDDRVFNKGFLDTF